MEIIHQNHTISVDDEVYSLKQCPIALKDKGRVLLKVYNTSTFYKR